MIGLCSFRSYGKLRGLSPAYSRESSASPTYLNGNATCESPSHLRGNEWPDKRISSRYRASAPLEREEGEETASLFGKFFELFCLSLIVNKNVAPWPHCDSTQIRPPWRSTIFLQIANPMPVPGYSLRECNRWKIWKIRSACCGSRPMPLSSTENTHCVLSRRAAT